MTKSLSLVAPADALASAPEAIPEQKPVSADIAVAGLSKRFRNGRYVLSNINLDIRKNEAVSLIGANGAGKSTLLRCMLRLIEPSGGTVTLLGEEITSLSRPRLKKMRARVGFIWQRHNLVPRLSVLSNVVHGAQGRSSSPGLWLQAIAPKAVREEAMHCLELVGLAHLAGRRCDTLSGGESQRVAIARALMQQPQIIMADEPVASLDPKVGEELMDFFVELVHQQGITLLYTSHDLHHALTYADRLVALQHGKVVINAPAEKLDRARLQDIYHEH